MSPIDNVEGMLSREELTQLIHNGDIETVVMGVTDPYGKLCGKRIDATFFLEEPHTNACSYLFACDMDMNPIPGFQKFSYDLGYGGMVASLATDLACRCDKRVGTHCRRAACAGLENSTAV